MGSKADYIDRVRPPSWKQTKHNNKGDGAVKWGGAGRRKGTPLLPLPFLYFHPVVLSLRISFWLAITLCQFQHPRCRASVNFITRAAKFVRTAGYCTIKTSNISMERFIKAYDDSFYFFHWAWMQYLRMQHWTNCKRWNGANTICQERSRCRNRCGCLSFLWRGEVWRHIAMVEKFLDLNNRSWQRRSFLLLNDGRKVWTAVLFLSGITVCWDPQILLPRERDITSSHLY